MVNKIIGPLVITALCIVAGALLLPIFLGIVLPVLLVLAVLRVRCWSKGKHTFSYGVLSNEILSCKLCFKNATPAEHDATVKQAIKDIEQLRRTKEMLDTMFSTPDELAVNTIIEQSKGSTNN